MAYFIKRPGRGPGNSEGTDPGPLSFFTNSWVLFSNMTKTFENYSLKHIQIGHFWS